MGAGANKNSAAYSSNYQKIMAQQDAQRASEARALKEKRDFANTKAKDSGLLGQYGPMSQASYQNKDGSWARPEYNTVLDPETGLLTGNYQVDNTLNTQGLDKFRQEALRDAGTDSAWAQMALDQNNMDMLANQDNLASQLNSGQRMAFDSLASSGGLDGGARERIARGGLRELMQGKQGVARDSQANALDIRMQDEGNRMNMLGQLPGMEIKKSQFDADIQNKNVSNALNERNFAYGNEMDAWKKNQEVWAAEKQASAQAKAAKQSCFHPETPINMVNGQRKLIKDVCVGDRLLVGGEVTAVHVTKTTEATDMYRVRNVLVTGSHLILDGTWKPVRDFEGAVRVSDVPEEVINLSTKGHVIVASDIIFSDNDDVDDVTLSDEEACTRKNEEWTYSRSTLSQKGA